MLKASAAGGAAPVLMIISGQLQALVSRVNIKGIVM
jgi:hypothetical protein